MRKVQGFTIIELMVVIAIIAILAAAAVPNINSYMESRRVVSAAESIYSYLLYARSEAISRSQPVVLRITPENSATGTWELGVSTDTDCSPAIGNNKDTHTPDTANACVLSVSGVNVFKRLVGKDYKDVTVAITGVEVDDTHTITFDPVRGTVGVGENITIKVLHNKMELNVIVAPIGRVKICSPVGSGKRYKSCS